MASPICFRIHWRVPVGCGCSASSRGRARFIRRSLFKCGRSCSRADATTVARAHLDAADAAAYKAAWLDEHSLTSAQTSTSVEHGDHAACVSGNLTTGAAVARRRARDERTRRDAARAVVFTWRRRGMGPNRLAFGALCLCGRPRHTLRVIPEPVARLLLSLLLLAVRPPPEKLCDRDKLTDV